MATSWLIFASCDLLVFGLTAKYDLGEMAFHIEYSLATVDLLTLDLFSDIAYCVYRLLKYLLYLASLRVLVVFSDDEGTADEESAGESEESDEEERTSRQGSDEEPEGEYGRGIDGCRM